MTFKHLDKKNITSRVARAIAQFSIAGFAVAMLIGAPFFIRTAQAAPGSPETLTCSASFNGSRWNVNVTYSFVHTDEVLSWTQTPYSMGVQGNGDGFVGAAEESGNVSFSFNGNAWPFTAMIYSSYTNEELLKDCGGNPPSGDCTGGDPGCPCPVGFTYDAATDLCVSPDEPPQPPQPPPPSTFSGTVTASPNPVVLCNVSQGAINITAVNTSNEWGKLFLYDPPTTLFPVMLASMPPQQTSYAWYGEVGSSGVRIRITDSANIPYAGILVTTEGCPAPTVTLDASPNPVTYDTPTTLSWTSTNATGCVATNGDGFFTGGATSGNDLSNNLTVDTTFSISCTGDGSPTPVIASRSVTVTVSDPKIWMKFLEE